MQKVFIKNKGEILEIDGTEKNCIQFYSTNSKFPEQSELVIVRNEDIPKLLSAIKEVKPMWCV